MAPRPKNSKDPSDVANSARAPPCTCRSFLCRAHPGQATPRAELMGIRPLLTGRMHRPRLVEKESRNGR